MPPLPSFRRLVLPILLGAALLPFGGGALLAQRVKPAARKPRAADPKDQLLISVHWKQTASKTGDGSDLYYEATLRPDPTEPGTFRGRGTYRGAVSWRKANCHNGLPDNPQRRSVAGQLDAMAMVAAMEDKRVLSYTLTTLDWTLLPFVGDATTAEEREMAKGLGTIAYLMLPLAEPVTRKHEERTINENDCVGVVRLVQDIAIGARLHPCDPWDGRTGPAGGEAEQIRVALAQGVAARGGHADASYVSIEGETNAGPFLKFSMILGRGDRPLPNRDCIREKGANGEIPEGSEEGGKKILTGGVQQTEDATRVTVRTVDVETGQVLATGQGDASGTDAGAIQQATNAALGQLGMGFGQ